jgi:hypothetical protein
MLFQALNAAIFRGGACFFYRQPKIHNTIVSKSAP